jgi:hypothetical protein
MDALHTVTGGMPSVRTVVALNRFDDHHDLHRRNRQWLAARCDYAVVTLPGDVSTLADLVTKD